jgi:hypothetical protein
MAMRAGESEGGGPTDVGPNAAVGEEKEETEEDFVRDLLVAHPALNEAEARWLWQERERARRG